MKKYFKYIPACIMAAMACTSCNQDYVQQEKEWTGSQNPENTSYRNPVWEPSLAGGTVVKAASGFVALSQETEWAKGVPYCVPAVNSANAMKWSYSQNAFSYTTNTGKTDPETGEPIINKGSRPAWISNKVDKVSADFCKTIAGANYWMAYLSGADNAIGMASSASSALGPYTDMGMVISAEKLGVTTLYAPTFTVTASTNYYLGYNTEDGAYLQALNVRKGQTPTTKGAAVKVAGREFSDVCIYRKDASNFYLIGTVTKNGVSEIRYGHASKVTGPYTDKAGVELTDGASNGELLVQAGPGYINPENPMRMFQSENGFYYLAYNCTEAGKEAMPSGYARKPLFLNPVEMDADGWFSSVIVPAKGWTSPRFE